MLTLSLPTPTLLVEQGFAGFLAVAGCIWFGSAATHRQPLCTTLFPRSPGFDSPPFVGQTLAETRCLREPAPCSGYPGASMSAPFFQKTPAPVHASYAGGTGAKRWPERARQYRFPTWRSCRSAAFGPQLTDQAMDQLMDQPMDRQRAVRRTVNSAVFHNASLNAHIEWRFP